MRDERRVMSFAAHLTPYALSHPCNLSNTDNYYTDSASDGDLLPRGKEAL